MEKLSVQLTIEQCPGKDAASGLEHRDVLDIPELPADSCDGRKLGFELFQDGDGVSLRCNGDVTVNGEQVSGTCALHIGDIVSVDGYGYGLYIRRHRPPLRMLCHVLSVLSKGIALLCLIAEVCVMCGSSLMLDEVGLWDGSIMTQRIVRRIDKLRSRMGNIGSEGMMRRAIAAELLTELNARAMYVRAYDRGMTRRQRREMMGALDRMEAVVVRLEDNAALEIDEIGEPELDAAVKRTLGQ